MSKIHSLPRGVYKYENYFWMLLKSGLEFWPSDWQAVIKKHYKMWQCYYNI